MVQAYSYESDSNNFSSELIQLQKQLVISLHSLKGIGWHAINKVLRHQLWAKNQWSEQDLIFAGLRSDQISVIVTAFRKKDWRETIHLSDDLLNEGVSILTPFDPLYPTSLLQIAQPPWMLYIKGRVELLQRPAVAIVGTRVPTMYGRHIARNFSQKLSSEGLTVVSGLARGVDAEAHKAALSEAGATIAVLPTPINKCYPPEHHSLYRAIVHSGLIVTETPIGEHLHRGQFHQRNRIIAGLTQATIIIESGDSGGSLITAKHALEMNREVFAVPGPIVSAKSVGTNELIKQGAARLITEIDQIYKEIPWLRDRVEQFVQKQSCNVEGMGRTVNNDNPETITSTQAVLTNQEVEILQLLAEKPLTFDEMMSHLAIPFGHLNILLLNLCIKQKIIQQPDSIYMLV
ncbi:DNA-processing protein DprA [Paenibacillus yanchengensis]|uniref:DNA-processing protein DprA n=1 Tax=Paenibacillus yanchengensis TaxID=2035833 RepID=A0ABW4YM71_9BACL